MADDPDLMPTAQPASDGAAAARHLLRTTSFATLATTDGMAPYAALVTPACMPDLSVVLLLSELSQHTSQLRANPLCSLLCLAVQAPEQPPALINPQARARLSLVCQAEVDADSTLRERYLRLHPYAALYADFGDFHFWRVRIRRGQLVQGFAQASSFSGADLAPSAQTAAALQAAEAGVLQHCNQDHADAMRLLGRAFGGVDDAAWRLVAIDPDGCDLIAPTARARVAWPSPIRDAGDLRRAIVGLVDRARDMSSSQQPGGGAAGAAPVS
jgi:putative heme iron utilization protein